MINTEDDLALQTLLNVKAEIAPGLDDDLILRCYAIQKRYQFGDEFNRSFSAMERLIDEALNKQQDQK